MDARSWIDAFAAALGVEAPDEATVTALLALAGTAAHASERVAAPIACYLLGRSGSDLERAMELAQRIAPER